RSPLSPVPKDRFSLDLHVLSAPPAFVLSQDQTLREELVAGTRGENNPARQFSHFERCSKVTSEDATRIDQTRKAEADLSGSRRMNAVEFSKTGAASYGRKKASDSRQRPPKQIESYRIRVGPGRLLGRVPGLDCFAASTSRSPEGQPV